MFDDSMLSGMSELDAIMGAHAKQDPVPEETPAETELPEEERVPFDVPLGAEPLPEDDEDVIYTPEKEPEEIRVDEPEPEQETEPGFEPETPKPSFEPETPEEPEQPAEAEKTQVVPEPVPAPAKKKAKEKKEKREKPAKVKKEKKEKPEKKPGRVGKAVTVVSFAALVAAVGILGYTILDNGLTNQTELKSVAQSILPAGMQGDTQEEASVMAKNPVVSDFCVLSKGNQWTMETSSVAVKSGDAAATVSVPGGSSSFQYDGKALHFEKDGVAYQVSIIQDDAYNAGIGKAESQNDTEVVWSGVAPLNNGKVLVLLASCPLAEKNAKGEEVAQAIDQMLSSAAPAASGAGLTVNGVALNVAGYDVAFADTKIALKNGDTEILIIPTGYQSEEIDFTKSGTTASGADVTHGSYVAGDTDGYLIEAPSGNFLAVTNDADALTAVLQLA